MIVKVIPNLNQILEQRGITQTQLSKMTGLPQGTISRFDRTNRREDINMFLIARALNINIEDLFIVIEEDLKK